MSIEKSNGSSAETPDTPTPEEMYDHLRHMALSVTAERLGLESFPGTPYGVLMETGYPNAVATLAAMGEGAVSLYLSSGGGVLGGGKHDSVRTAGLALVAAAAEFLHFMEPTETYPLPLVGKVTFYALTPEGVYSYESDRVDLEFNGDPLSPLFQIAQDTITELRLISE